MTSLSIGEKLTLLRSRKKISKKELAELTDMHWTSISKYERNEAAPSIDALRKLALVLNVSADYLLFDNVEQQPEIKDKEILKLASDLDGLPEIEKNRLKNMMRSYLTEQPKK